MAHDKKAADEMPEHDADEAASTTDNRRRPKPNPPRTKLWGIVAPKFGSAGSGGAEIEPGPEAD